RRAYDQQPGCVCHWFVVCFGGLAFWRLLSLPQVLEEEEVGWVFLGGSVPYPEVETCAGASPV
ncbi:MAG: hypothetical protein ACKPKO_48940, partial [Candidatus Fonsibacter sp.]